MLCLNTEHESIVCPRHEGAFDCNPFCDICEAEQEYCPTCQPWEHEQATNYLRMMNDTNQED